MTPSQRDFARSLRKLEASVRVFAAELAAGHAPDPTDLQHLARQIGAQAELVEMGLHDA